MPPPGALYLRLTLYGVTPGQPEGTGAECPGKTTPMFARNGARGGQPGQGQRHLVAPAEKRPLVLGVLTIVLEMFSIAHERHLSDQSRLPISGRAAVR